MIRSLPKALVTAFALLVAASACESHVVDPKRDVRMEHVVRVFMHDEYLYSVTVRQPGSSTLEIRPLRCNASASMCVYKLIADVPPESEMWVLCHYNDSDTRIGYDIHLHSEKDLNGSRWDHGKQGQGITTVVE